MKGVKNLQLRQLKAVLLQNPTISSLEELIAVRGIKLENCTEDEIKVAKELIERNRIRQLVLIKQELYHKADMKSRLQLYKMLCNEEELQRFGIYTKEVSPTVNVNPVIEIKCADPETIDKLKEL